MSRLHNLGKGVMTRVKSSILLLVFISLGINSVKSQYFEVYPKPTCVPCGGPTFFNCSTITHINIGGGRFVDGPGGQLWRINTTDGNVTELYSTNPSSARPLGYEFISTDTHVYTGLQVLDTDSTLNGTTFQCIAYTPSNTSRQNHSASAVTLKVGGPPSNACECQCLDVNGSATSEQSTSIRPANSCTCAMPSPTQTSLQPSTQVFLHPQVTQNSSLSAQNLLPSEIPNPTSSPTSHGSSTEAIIGGVVGTFLFVALITVIVLSIPFCIYKRKRRDSTHLGKKMKNPLEKSTPE